MTVSIIIAVKTWQKNLEECVAKCLELDYKDFEIIILPDSELPPAVYTLLRRASSAISVIPTGSLKPGDKRDIGLKSAKGDVFAFIDDDAYPVKNWLTDALKNFNNSIVAAVGGPAVTPAQDSLRQQASGCIYSSILVSGKFVYRYIPGKRQEVDDLPSCNFIVRKEIIDELGGFDTKFWPGEDTKLCHDIVHKLGKKIIYDPNVLVFHHRRTVFDPHLKQIANYALHRGYFVKKYPKTSLRLAYFIPSLFVLGLLVGPVFSILSFVLKLLYLFVISLYLVIVFVSSFISSFKDMVGANISVGRFSRKVAGGLSLMSLVYLGIMLTHITYGVFFIKGLLTSNLEE